MNLTLFQRDHCPLCDEAYAVLAASIFHFGEYTIAEAKEYLASRGISVRR